jgi:deoxyribodipyrimidine photolyase-related protein
MLDAMGVDTMGSVNPERLDWPVSRDQALRLLESFVKDRLPRFGPYQDAMAAEDGLLFHSRLSFALNVKLLHPEEILQAAVRAWEEEPQRYPLASVEGFVRQVFGWREYMRGMYWFLMPGLKDMNHFGHDGDLPAFYWSGDTAMRCLRLCIRQSLKTAYAHHIQRLMVTGSFALLAGVHPDAVDHWYLGIYADAVEWVQLPNTRGMSQFADGGIIATKPYVSSANYIRKMSDYCGDCDYEPGKRHGNGACPFNSLFWDFYARHREKLENQPRIGMMYRTWDRMDAVERRRTRRQAERYREHIHSL